MIVRSALLLGVLGSLAAGTALAQTGTTPMRKPVARMAPADSTRNPNLGDPGTRSAAAARRRATPAQDTPDPSSQNGNQPDRASAAGGGR